MPNHKTRIIRSFSQNEPTLCLRHMRGEKLFYVTTLSAADIRQSTWVSVGMILRGQTEVLGEKPVPVPLCPAPHAKATKTSEGDLKQRG
jgi:hypothetical protein